MTATGPTPEYLTTKEVSELLNIRAATLRTWRRDDEGPRSFKMGGVRYLRADVDEWVAAQYRDGRGGVR